MSEVDPMVEVIEVDGWSALSEEFVIDVKSLDDLRMIAVRLGIPFIYQRRKEYILLCSSGSSIHFYRFKKKHETL